MSGRVFVGIDGGGTRARAVVVDEHGRELARRMGPAGIVQAADPCAAAAAAAELTRGVLRDAGVESGAAALCCGLAGAGRPREREAVRVALALEGVAAEVLVVGDAEAALADAFGDAAGILVIAGTGSIAWARTGTGAVVRGGGWGQLLGDEGSGHAMGLEALRAVARSADGRAPATSLTEAVLAAVNCAAPDDLIRFAASASKADVAALAPLVLAHAGAGDRTAADIRDHAVAELALLTTTIAARAALESPSCAFAGALIEPGGPLRESLVAALAAALPNAEVQSRRVDAARGAALLARRPLG